MKVKKLMAKWNKKERDIMIYYPHKPDGGMLSDFISHDKNCFGKSFRQELESRGYDITTLKISCERIPGYVAPGYLPEEE